MQRRVDRHPVEESYVPPTNGLPSGIKYYFSAPRDGVEKCVWALRKGEVVADRILRG